MRARYQTIVVRKPIREIGALPGDWITRFPDGRSMLHRRIPVNDGWMLSLEMDGVVEQVDIIPSSAPEATRTFRRPHRHFRVLPLIPRP